MPEEKTFIRRIRSFVKRQGRLTLGQQRALDHLFPLYGLELQDETINLSHVFQRSAPTILEIGFGNGTSLAEMAANNPQQNYIGVEVHSPGVGNLLLQIEERGLTNIRVINDDAVDVLNKMIGSESLDAVYLFFADPWHKKRHHKRRIVQKEFVQLLRKKLKNGGVFHMATDWEHYAQHMMQVMNESEGFENTAGKDQYLSRPKYRPLTKFEQRGQRLGHGVWDLIFKKVN
ncbi:MAG TPA: tRNA (guanosine(46)-N7)-methyltransferase TrmB [Gammaproteobacteria bacterium]|nr:tRNA (guanosine(46)-N7)-methyltransferase TrmB [Gammaproteobacteria bacterium]